MKMIIKMFTILLFFPMIASEQNFSLDKQDYIEALTAINSKGQEKTEEFIKLSANTDINRQYGPNQESLLHIAITGCNVKAARLLIELGINTSQKDKRGWAPLTNLVVGASSYDEVEYPKLAELLLTKGKVVLDEETMKFLPECNNKKVREVIESFKKEMAEENS